MKLNSKEANRTLHAHLSGGDIILIECERYMRIGGVNRWDETRVRLTVAEARKLGAWATLIEDPESHARTEAK